MKVCTKCFDKKELSEFSKNTKHPDGLQYACKTCVAHQSKNWYRQNKVRVRKHTGSYRKRLWLRIAEIKRSTTCYLCSENEPACLDFHHKDPSTKEFEISNIVGRGQSWNTILEEIEKCVCICSNCHRKIHAGLISLI